VGASAANTAVSGSGMKGLKGLKQSYKGDAVYTRTIIRMPPRHAPAVDVAPRNPTTPAAPEAIQTHIR